MSEKTQKGNKREKKRERQGDWGTRQSAPGAGRGQKQELGVSSTKSHRPGASKEVKAVTTALAETSISSKTTGLLDLVPSRLKKQREEKKGEFFRVETNHFPIKLRNPNLIIFQYSVEIQPQTPKYMLRPAWNIFIKKNFPGRYPVYDGKNIAYSAGPLLDGNSLADSFQVLNPDNEKMKDYKVEIKFATKVHLGEVMNFLKSSDTKVNVPAAALAAIDVALRNHASNILVRANRNLFPQPKGNIISLGEGMELWHGYYQSVSLGWKVYLNFDVASKGFPNPDILKTIEELCLTDYREVKRVSSNTFLDHRNIQKLNKHLSNLKVEYKIPECPDSKRVYKVNGVRSVPAIQEFFSLEDGKKTNVVQYYADAKNYRVKYPNLPCLWVGSRKNTIYVPIELCSVVPGQARTGMLTDTQTSNMVKYVSDPPAVRKQKITTLFNQASMENDYSNEFGISVSGEFEKVDARVLNAPLLQSGKEMRVQRGEWKLDKFFKPMPLKNWCVLTLDDRASQLERDFVKEIIEQAKYMGMNPESPISHDIICDPFRNPNSIMNAFTKLNSMKVNIVFVIIPDRGDIYSKVKKISEIEVGVLTQCIRSSTLRKTFSPRGTNRSTLSNILLKVNTKLNGINHSIHSQSRPKCLECVTMIVGADVTHPPPGSKTVPSIAAVAASHDTKATQYNTIRKLQPSKVEVILDFKEIMREQLMYFYKKTGFKPQRIIVFRDGVSEGQVGTILEQELRAIQQACTSLQAGDNKMDYQPLITFVIVQKRHHTRFFPMPGNKYCNDRFHNVPAGTCVDTEIVHPRDVDFYLVSHWSRLGTARPTKYKLIYDDSDMTENELETLTYYLCHLISRCSKSISYPAPTYYAHLAALRGRIHLDGKNVSMDSKEDQERGQKHINVRNYFLSEAPMFFV